MKPVKVRFLSKEEAAQIEKDGVVPVYRVRYGQRSFMCYAKRDERLRGAVELRFTGDTADSAELEIAYAKSEA